jgi:hypothetical protein
MDDNGIAVVSLCLASTPTWAGSKQQHRWEGVAIGVGAVIAGSALISHNAYRLSWRTTG